MEPALKRVLVVDDDETTLALVRATLDEGKFEVSGASDGMAGFTRARAERPDLIILDVLMPRQVGFYTLRDLKTDPATRHIPVVMLTAVSKVVGMHYSSDDIAEFLGIEPNVFLEKPVDPLRLREIADELVSASE
ncbi:MAG: response regulator [Planctomycetes bacterium]|nr:response regulator [Planctomycetota bacterium]